MNKIVARFQDGRLVKGFTNDFLPAKDVFHLVPADSAPGSKPQEVKVFDLKALFFVRDFAGDAGHQGGQDFAKPPVGRKIKVVFKDGETLLGTTQGYQPGRSGFFILPADAGSNNERCFIVAAATQDISFI
jgi:hypothetical protein